MGGEVGHHLSRDCIGVRGGAVACLAAIDADESAFRYSLVAAQCLQLLHGHPEVDRVKIPFLKLAVSLAVSLGHDPKPYNKQLSELRYSGIKTDTAPTLLEVVRDKYIHTATEQLNLGDSVTDWRIWKSLTGNLLQILQTLFELRLC